MLSHAVTLLKQGRRINPRRSESNPKTIPKSFQHGPKIFPNHPKISKTVPKSILPLSWWTLSRPPSPSLERQRQNSKAQPLSGRALPKNRTLTQVLSIV